jgi:hypothetical protein
MPSERLGLLCLELSQTQREPRLGHRSAGLQSALGGRLTVLGHVLAGSAVSRLQAGAPAPRQSAAETRCANPGLRSRGLAFLACPAAPGVEMDQFP